MNKHLSFGLYLLSKIPEERLFQLFVDGDKHLTERGSEGFESREPNCMVAFYDGLKVALLNAGKKVDVNEILDIHAHATKGVEGELTIRDNLKGVFRKNLRMYPFVVPNESITVAGIRQILSGSRESRQLYLKPPARLSVKFDNRGDLDGIEISLSKEILSTDTSEIFNVFESHSKNGRIEYTPPGEGVKDIRDAVEDILRHLSDDIENASNEDEKILGIVRRVQQLELLHPFSDANGRVFVNILLNRLLIENGFPPATFYQPNIFDLFSEDDLLFSVKDAMMHTLEVIKNPDFNLYGFATNYLDDGEKKHLRDQASPLMRTIHEMRKSVNLNQQEYDEHLRYLSAFLEAGYSDEIRLFRACVLGDVDYLKKSDISKNQLKNIAPENSPPLYRGLTLLHLACKMHQIPIVICLLEMDLELINQVDQSGKTSLHYAAASGDIHLVELLLKNNADLSKQDCDGQRALDIAAKSGSLEVFEFLYAKNDQANTSESDIKLFISAIYGKNIAIVKWLVNNKKVTYDQINEMKFKHDKNPYVIALEMRDEITFKYLWDILEDKQIEDKKLFKILLPSLVKNSLFILDLVSKKFENLDGLIGFANFYDALEYHRFDDEYILKLMELVSEVDNVKHVTNENLLHLFVRANRSSLVRKLLESGKINVNAPTIDFSTPLHYASELGYIDIIDMLCKAKADPNYQKLVEKRTYNKFYFYSPSDDDEDKTPELNSPLFRAIFSRNLKAVECLIANGAIPTKEIFHGKIPLHYAVEYGLADIVKLLISLNPESVDKETIDGKTPLDYAAKFGHEDIIDILCSAKADVNHKTSGKFNSFQENSSDNHLFRSRDDFDFSENNEDGDFIPNSPLFLAVLGGHLKSAERLIAHGAEVSDDMLSYLDKKNVDGEMYNLIFNSHIKSLKK